MRIIIAYVSILLIFGFIPVNSDNIEYTLENPFEIAVDNFECKSTEVTKSLSIDTPGMIWNYTYNYGSGHISDKFDSFIRYVNDGFILQGDTYSFGNGTVGDVWLVRTNEDGIKQWENKISIGEDDDSVAIMVKQSGSYVIVGNSRPEYYPSYEGSFMFSAASTNGVKLWTRLYGDTFSISDASTHSFNDIYLVTGRKDNHIWLMKTNYEGVPIWERLILMRV